MRTDSKTPDAIPWMRTSSWACPPTPRSYDIGAQILTDIGVAKLRLMSNNPLKFTELEGYRLEIVDRVPLVTAPTPEKRK